MKTRWAGWVAAALLASPALAQDEEDLKGRLEKKLKAPFLAKAAWHTDYDKAREESRKASKPIFAYFTRSYSP